MNKNVKGVLTVIGVVAVVLAVHHFTNRGKKAAAKQIIKLNGTTSSYASLLTMDEGYVKAWAKALTKGKEDFTYNNETYRTQGGTKIV